MLLPKPVLFELLLVELLLLEVLLLGAVFEKPPDLNPPEEDFELLLELLGELFGVLKLDDLKPPPDERLPAAYTTVGVLSFTRILKKLLLTTFVDKNINVRIKHNKKRFLFIISTPPLNICI